MKRALQIAAQLALYVPLMALIGFFSTEPRFATRIEFDDRLTTMRAPGFPLSDRYELDAESDEWRVVGAVD